LSKKLDYTPGVFTAEQHVRGKWIYRERETLTLAPIPAHVIDKGIPTAGLPAHVVVAKFADHWPLYRQEKIFFFGGQGSRLRLQPEPCGRACTQLLGQWNGKLDNFAGYKASFQQGITEIGCMVHARRKFFDLHATNKSQLAEQALHSFGGLYEIERQARETTDKDRWRIRQEKAAPLIDALHA